LGDDKTGTSESLKSYTDATGIGWLQNASVSDSSSKSKGTAAYTVEAGSDRLSGLISGLSGGQVTGFDVVASGSVMPMDYDAKGFFGARNAATYKPRTLSMIEYPSFEKPAKFSPEGAFRSVKSAMKTIQDLVAAIQKAQTPPTPPKPSAKPGGGPGTKPNPVPSAQVATPKPSPPLPPGFDQALAMIDGGKEPFTMRKAVAPNPRHRNDNDSNRPDKPDGKTETFQKDYIAPRYEDSGPGDEEKMKASGRYKMTTLNAELKTYEDLLNGDPQVLQGKASVKDVCTQVGRVAQTLKTNPLVKGALSNVDKWTKPLYDKVDTEYKNYDRSEKKLFSR
jgi:hypothetical protein